MEHIFIKKAKLEDSPIFFADNNFEAELVENENINYNIINIKKNGKLFLEKIKIPLTGDYQKKT